MTKYTANETVEEGDQYSLVKILSIWAAATLPMAVVSWILFPLVAPDFDSDPLGSSVTRVVLLTLGLIWLFVLSMIIIRREEGNLRWAMIKRRLRFNAQRDPKSGERRRRLWLWVLPALIGIVLFDVVLVSAIDGFWVSIIPFLAEPAGFNFAAIFESQEILDRLRQ